MTPQTSLSPLPNGHQELKISGHFTHPHWMAFLFSGLAKEGVSIVSGRAGQRGTEWQAQWILDFARSQAAPDALDYATMALQRGASGAAGAPHLSRYQIARRADESLEVWLFGPDQIGFLGRVLSRLSLIMLFPTAIEVDTMAGQIRDYGVFRGIGGAAPNAEAERALGVLLKGCVGA